jgi:hypothetical protein
MVWPSEMLPEGKLLLARYRFLRVDVRALQQLFLGQVRSDSFPRPIGLVYSSRRDNHKTSSKPTFQVDNKKAN